jgi:hypothetical protein
MRLLNAAGRGRSPVTLPRYLAGRPSRNKGLRYSPDRPTVGSSPSCASPATAPTGPGRRALLVLLKRAGLRIHETLTVAEHDLNRRLAAILVRHGTGGRRREAGMDWWGWEHLRPGSNCGWGCRSVRCRA